MSRPVPPFPWSTEPSTEPQPIYGRIATRVDELHLAKCSSCGVDVLEPPPAAGPIAGMAIPPICRPCVKAAVLRGDTVMAAQPFADRAP